ncbi:nucleic acid binding protein [Kalanchoe latent virus]|uniref:RNA silencing suppressor n=1 Tax=Kalanchoe latent virus TaxID=132477 RepID=C7AGF5_9VIRU|nr:nucleic acid binding protein [Kalanchoe latent virus]ACL01039.1 nucleic acid binding protein [Kalanchoe latent virus]UZN89661.1 nucleic acid binding protein [Kalanchoe latent virus]
MQTMGETKSWKKAVIFSLYNKLPLCLCVHIMRRASSRCVGTGRSTYARRRRAISIGRCERCYRCYPPICNSKCDNKTCFPGISSNEKIVNFIRYGATTVIPYPGF